MFTTIRKRSLPLLYAALFTLVFPGKAVTQAQSFPLDSVKDLALVNAKADVVEYKGRKAVHLTTDDLAKGGFALLPGTNFQDGIIEGDIAIKIDANPGFRMPGFVGIAFRGQSNASRYELFYLRPENSRSDDQAMRNHSLQYVSEPNFGWYKLRREWPWVYESHTDLQTETWTKVKIEVKGRTAKLYVNGSTQPNLVVDGLKGEDLKGGIALWGYKGEDAYFSNFRVTPTKAVPIQNGSDATGSWQVHLSSDYGSFDSTMSLSRSGNALTGTWSGGLGSARPVRGTWRNGYVELRFNAEWSPGPGLDTVDAPAVLAGWVDGSSASGRMTVQGKTDGVWTATRKP